MIEAFPKSTREIGSAVMTFCRRLLRDAESRPILVGIQAPQGAGKTTLVRYLVDEFPQYGLRATGVSIDDFYLTHAAQLRLAGRNPGNPYLEHRGYPGTHDIELGAATLRALSQLGPGSIGSAQVPVYDKSQHGGRGDRAPEETWRSVRAPLDVVFVEGWMLGFAPVEPQAITDPNLAAPNKALAEYDRWYQLIDAMVVIRAQNPLAVLKWRVEAEENMKAQGKPGLSREAIEDYVRRFLPAYELYAGRAESWPSDETLVLTIDDNRELVRSSSSER